MPTHPPWPEIIEEHAYLVQMLSEAAHDPGALEQTSSLLNVLRADLRSCIFKVAEIERETHAKGHDAKSGSSASRFLHRVTGSIGSNHAHGSKQDGKHEIDHNIPIEVLLAARTTKRTLDMEVKNLEVKTLLLRRRTRHHEELRQRLHVLCERTLGGSKHPSAEEEQAEDEARRAQRTLHDVQKLFDRHKTTTALLSQGDAALTNLAHHLSAADAGKTKPASPTACRAEISAAKICAIQVNVVVNQAKRVDPAFFEQERDGGILKTSWLSDVFRPISADDEDAQHVGYSAALQALQSHHAALTSMLTLARKKLHEHDTALRQAAHRCEEATAQREALRRQVLLSHASAETGEDMASLEERVLEGDLEGARLSKGWSTRATVGHGQNESGAECTPGWMERDGTARMREITAGLDKALPEMPRKNKGYPRTPEEQRRPQGVEGAGAFQPQTPPRPQPQQASASSSLGPPMRPNPTLGGHAQPPPRGIPIEPILSQPRPQPIHPPQSKSHPNHSEVLAPSPQARPVASSHPPSSSHPRIENPGTMSESPNAAVELHTAPPPPSPTTKVALVEPTLRPPRPSPQSSPNRHPQTRSGSTTTPGSDASPPSHEHGPGHAPSSSAVRTTDSGTKVVPPPARFPPRAQSFAHVAHSPPKISEIHGILKSPVSSATLPRPPTGDDADPWGVKAAAAPSSRPQPKLKTMFNLWRSTDGFKSDHAKTEAAKAETAPTTVKPKTALEQTKKLNQRMAAQRLRFVEAVEVIRRPAVDSDPYDDEDEDEEALPPSPRRGSFVWPPDDDEEREGSEEGMGGRLLGAGDVAAIVHTSDDGHASSSRNHGSINTATTPLIASPTSITSSSSYSAESHHLHPQPSIASSSSLLTPPSASSHSGTHTLHWQEASTIPFTPAVSDDPVARQRSYQAILDDGRASPARRAHAALGDMVPEFLEPLRLPPMQFQVDGARAGTAERKRPEFVEGPTVLMTPSQQSRAPPAPAPRVSYDDLRLGYVRRDALTAEDAERGPRLTSPSAPNLAISSPAGHPAPSMPSNTVPPSYVPSMTRGGSISKSDHELLHTIFPSPSRSTALERDLLFTN